jgi:hypothetical protein
LKNDHSGKTCKDKVGTTPVLLIDAGGKAAHNAAVAAKVDAAVATKIDIDNAVAKLDEDKNKKASDDKKKNVSKVKEKVTAAKFDERAGSLKEREKVLLSESKSHESQKLHSKRRDWI